MGDTFEVWWEALGSGQRFADYRGYAEAGWHAALGTEIQVEHPWACGGDDPDGFAEWFEGLPQARNADALLRDVARDAWAECQRYRAERAKTFIHYTQGLTPCDLQDVLPADLAELVQGLLEGRVVQFALAVEYDDGVVTQVKRLEPDANWWKLVGMTEVLKCDVMDNVNSDDFDFDGEEDA